MAGMRIGFAIACPEVATMLRRVAPLYECGSLSVAMMMGMLDREADMMASVSRLKDGKRYFVEAMGQLGIRAVHGHGCFVDRKSVGEGKSVVVCVNLGGRR